MSTSRSGVAWTQLPARPVALEGFRGSWRGGRGKGTGAGDIWLSLGRLGRNNIFTRDEHKVVMIRTHTHKGICLQMAVAPINTKSFREKCELAFPTGLTVSFVSFLSFIPLDRFFFFCMSVAGWEKERECE